MLRVAATVRLLVAAAMLLITAAASRGSEHVAEHLEEALRHGDVQRAAELVAEKDAARQLQDESDMLLRVCEEAEKRCATLRAADEKAAKRVADFLVTTAEPGAAAHPKDDESVRTLALALEFRGRLSRLAKKPGPPLDLLRALDLIEKLHAMDEEEEETLDRAMRLVGEAAQFPKNNFDRLLMRAEKLAVAVAGQRGDTEECVLAIAQLRVTVATGAMGPKRKVAKEALRLCFEGLRPMTSSDDPPIDLVTQHNATVTLGRVHKLALREHYITRTVLHIDKSLRFELPISNRWRLAEPQDRDERYQQVQQLDENGRLLRVIRFKKYSWAAAYIQGDGSYIGGDNPKNLARACANDVTEWFSEIDEASPVKKGRLNKSLVAHAFEMNGLDDDGKPMRVRAWYFGSKRQLTYELTMRSYCDDPKLDPAMRATLDSFRELER